MPLTPITDFVVTGGRAGVYIRVVDNLDGVTTFITPLPTDANGQANFSAAAPPPPGDYTASMSVVNGPPWTTYDPHYRIAYTRGDIQQLTTQNIPYAAIITPNLTLGQILVIGALTADITINNPTNILPNQLVVLVITQDNVGAHGVNLGLAFKNGFTPNQAANSTTYIPFLADAAGNLWALTSSAAASTGVLDITAGTNVTIGGSSQHPVINAAEAGIYIPTTSDASLLGTAGPNLVAEIISRDLVSSRTRAPFVSGQLSGWAITLVKGQPVTKLGIQTGALAAVWGTNNDSHQWFVLFDKHGNALCVTLDDGFTAWGTDQFKLLTVDRFATGGTYLTVPPTAWGASGSGPYTAPANDLYYVAAMLSIGTGGVPALPQFLGLPIDAASGMYKPTMAWSDTTHAGLLLPTSCPFVATVANPQGSTRVYGGVA